MSAVFSRWNSLALADALREALSLCGSHAWASYLVAGRPYADEARLAQAADQIWWSLHPDDWLEAFQCHPRIGEQKPQTLSPGSAAAPEQAVAWSKQEQSAAISATTTLLDSLRAGNQAYEQRFGFNYIVCATGKSAEEMLTILHNRLANDRAMEMRAAAEQQLEITHIRLGKWLKL